MTPLRILLIVTACYFAVDPVTAASTTTAAAAESTTAAAAAESTTAGAAAESTTAGAAAASTTAGAAASTATAGAAQSVGSTTPGTTQTPGPTPTVGNTTVGPAVVTVVPPAAGNDTTTTVQSGTTAAPKPKTVKATISIPATWYPALGNTSSPDYAKLKDDMTVSLTTVLNSTAGFDSVNVTGFRSGSVVADFTVKFSAGLANNAIANVGIVLLTAINNGQLKVTINGTEHTVSAPPIIYTAEGIAVTITSPCAFYNATSACNTGSCTSTGTPPTPSCICPATHITGTYCETVGIPLPTLAIINLGLIIGLAALGVVILVVVIVLVVVCCCCKKDNAVG